METTRAAIACASPMGNSAEHIAHALATIRNPRWLLAHALATADNCRPRIAHALAAVFD